MRLHYWCSEALTDSKAYNIRTKTKQQCEKLLEEEEHDRYGPALSVTVEYSSAFDLVMKCLSEGGGYWEGDS